MQIDLSFAEDLHEKFHSPPNRKHIAKVNTYHYVNYSVIELPNIWLQGFTLQFQWCYGHTTTAILMDYTATFMTSGSDSPDTDSCSCLPDMAIYFLRIL